MDNLDSFENLLLKTIDETLMFCLGEANTKIIYSYLEQNHCSRKDIPKKLDFFSEELEKIVGSERGQMMGTAKIIENAIIEGMCSKMGISLDGKPLGYFPNQVRKLKEMHIQQKKVFLNKIRARYGSASSVRFKSQGTRHKQQESKHSKK